MNEWLESEAPVKQEIEYIRDTDGEQVRGTLYYHSSFAAGADAENVQARMKRLYTSDGYDRPFHVVKWRSV